MKLALDHMDMRELRTMFGAYNKRSWYRLMADMKDVSIVSHPNQPNSFKLIRECLEKFKIMKKQFNAIFGTVVGLTVL